MTDKIIVVGNDGRIMDRATLQEALDISLGTQISVDRQTVMSPRLKQEVGRVIPQPIVQGPPSRQQKRRKRFIEAVRKVKAMRLPRRERREMARRMGK